MVSLERCRFLINQEGSQLKKYIIAAAVAAATFAPQAFAQAKNFEGFSLAVGVNSVSTKLDWSGALTGSASGSGANLGLQAQYAMALGESFVLGLGVNAGVGDTSAGTPSGNSEVKLTNTSSVYVAPGFALNNSVQIYGKIAAINGSLGGGGSGSSGGMGYGLGAQVLSGKNVYYQAEYMNNKYNDSTSSGTTFKVSSDVFSFSVGYKF